MAWWTIRDVWAESGAHALQDSEIPGWHREISQQNLGKHDCHMPKLSTYLGHAHVNDTYWYISALVERTGSEISWKKSLSKE